MPFAEAAEQTVLQKVVPFERQGRVFGFAQSVEMAASPLTAFLISPIAQFVAIPFMTTGAGVELIGGWFGTGPERGLALVFTVAGLVGLVITLAALPHAAPTGGSPRATSGRPPWPRDGVPRSGACSRGRVVPRPRRHPRVRRVVRLLDRVAPPDGAARGERAVSMSDRVGRISRTVVRRGAAAVVVAGCATALLVGVGEMQRAAAQTTAVDLDAAAPFAVLASGSVTGAGTSSITGDVGGSAVTGLNNQVKRARSRPRATAPRRPARTSNRPTTPSPRAR